MAARLSMTILFLLLSLTIATSQEDTSPPSPGSEEDADTLSPPPDSGAPISVPPLSESNSPPSPPPSSESNSPPAPPPSSSSDQAPESSPTPSTPSPSEKSPAPAPAAKSSVTSKSSNVNADEMPQEEDDSGMSAGKKAGIAFGVIAGLCVVGLAGFVYKKRQDNIQRARYGYAGQREIPLYSF